jgi:hypothetical protein
MAFVYIPFLMLILVRESFIIFFLAWIEQFKTTSNAESKQRYPYILIMLHNNSDFNFVTCRFQLRSYTLPGKKDRPNKLYRSKVVLVLNCTVNKNSEIADIFIKHHMLHPSLV